MNFKKIFIVCLASVLTLAAVAQRNDWRTDIDEIIQKTDSLSLKSQRSFLTLKPYHKDKDVRETWYYTTNEGRVIIFEIQYVIDSMEFSEIYYLHKGSLICMEQYEAPYRSVYADQLKWGEAFFFRDNSLGQYVITGKPPRTHVRWSSEAETLARVPAALCRTAAAYQIPSLDRWHIFAIDSTKKQYA